MPYPVDISPTVTGYSFGINGSRGRFGFEYGGAWYAFLDRNSPGHGTAAPGDFKIHALKSTDLGQTWAELDSANAPSGSPGTGSPLVSGVADCYTVARDGATAWVLAVIVDDFQVIQGIAATPFNLTGLGSWGSSTNYGTPLPDYMSNNSGGGHQLMLEMAVCGPGNYQVLMGGTSETIAGHRYGRCWIASFDGSAFGSAAELPGQAGTTIYYAGISALGDADGRAHFFYTSNDSGPLGSPLYHVGLDVDGVTFGATQQITTDLYWSFNNVIGAMSEAILFADQIGIAAELNDNISSTSQSVHVFYATPALDPVWSDALASTGADLFDQNVPALDFSFWIPAALTLGYANGSLVVAWTINGFDWVPLPNAYWSTQSPYPAFSWTAPTQLFQPSIVDNMATHVLAFPVAAGVAIIGCGFASSGPHSDADFLAQIFLVPIGGARLLPNRIKLPGQIL